MDLKNKIKERGLKIKWVAEQIGCNASSLRVYLHNSKLMPTKVEQALKEFLR